MCQHLQQVQGFEILYPGSPRCALYPVKCERDSYNSFQDAAIQSLHTPPPPTWSEGVECEKSFNAFFGLPIIF